MTFCYVGKATKIFFFVVALLVLTALVAGFGLLHHGWDHKPRNGTPSSSNFPDPIPANATSTASPVRSEPISPPAAAPATTNPVVLPASPPPPPDIVAVDAPPPLALTQPAPVLVGPPPQP
ncbi:hypothetical protein HPP92_009398 [Vanilla planifolia]|uniref:Uncharacterized protein n=1 Tax=Vanilla planifolia TaxID=51239 RepID=A0A835V2T8_VANPL|nr:hypothetical protein HPP92_009398 [Vanilla planifolia]